MVKYCVGVLMVAAALVPMARAATLPAPENQRPAAAAQAVGAVHTLRQIPEACARLQGSFTGDAAQPYRFEVVRTSPQCQPRARMVPFATAKPSQQAGWILSDLIRVPSAACPQQQAVVQVWRLPVDNAGKRDGQGQSRIYLEDAKKQAASGQVAKVPQFTATMDVEGRCTG